MANGTTGTGTGTSTATIPTDPTVGQQTGTESSLSNWAGPYVTDMLGKGWALSETPYEAYTGPLTAGTSALQNQAFQGLANLTIPTAQQSTYTPQSFTSAGIAEQFMSPYFQASLNPQLEEARRQAQISRLEQAGRLTKAGAYGGGRQAIMESELNRNLLRNLADITDTGYQKAYESGMQQFNTEQNRQQAAAQQARDYGLAALQRQAEMGGIQRDIEQQGITEDRKQFEEERLDPFKKVQFQQSLVQGMPLATQSYNYSQPGMLSQILGQSGGIASFLDILFGRGGGTTGGGTTTGGGGSGTTFTSGTVDRLPPDANGGTTTIFT